ncbi:monooxygenase [Rhodopseudomonas palustris]|uniref:Monooxygenase n=1 Tax=Rhodopseudomonas palustris TaxID=1076 RepID=A0A323UNJ5_RHOPL|nr:FAD-dependent monooxygenase [Rhodopseudomonas palustris]PZA13931.1 monooxygenase [Rhodopseudomonas palustris]
MAASRTIIVAGAGIGGLTAALALAAKGFRVTVLERTGRLDEVGAGLQLSPNASRILVELGLRSRLEACAVVPDAVTAINARSGRSIVRMRIADVATRAGAPYWVVHRADLQAALAAQVAAHPAIDLRLGCAVDDVAPDADGVTVSAGGAQERALAVIGADGIWSAVRGRVFPQIAPRFSGLIAWRGTLPAEAMPDGGMLRGVQLWLGPDAHLVVYPISGGRRINLVAVVDGSWNQRGWSARGEPTEIIARFAHWAGAAQALIGAVENWTRWALFAMPDGGAWNQGPVALLGDASHGMLPFAAQGAGMAIEDAAVLAAGLAARHGEGRGAAAEVAATLQRYAALRQPRVRQVQRLARQNGTIYHLPGAAALARDVAMRALGPNRLLARQGWIYDWRP